MLKNQNELSITTLNLPINQNYIGINSSLKWCLKHGTFDIIEHNGQKQFSIGPHKFNKYYISVNDADANSNFSQAFLSDPDLFVGQFSSEIIKIQSRSAEDFREKIRKIILLIKAESV
jgi:hypothetical protein